MTDSNDDQPQQLSFFALLSSVLAAFLGVQSNANRERDFSKGKISHFIIIGLIAGAAFILIIVAVVNLVLSLSAN